MSDDWHGDRPGGMHGRREDPMNRMERREMEEYFGTGQHMKFWRPAAGIIVFFAVVMLLRWLFG
jgi:hypothetical protein